MRFIVVIVKIVSDPRLKVNSPESYLIFTEEWTTPRRKKMHPT